MGVFRLRKSGGGSSLRGGDRLRGAAALFVEHTFDAVLFGEVEVDHTFDAIAQSVGVEVDHTFDAITSASTEVTIDHTFDAIAKSVGVEVDHTFDAIAQSVGVAVDHTFDAIAQSVGVVVDHTFDAITRKVHIIGANMDIDIGVVVATTKDRVRMTGVGIVGNAAGGSIGRDQGLSPFRVRIYRPARRIIREDER